MLVVTVAVVFVNLGLWQLRRADERRMVNTVGQSRIGEEPLPLETLLDAAGDDISSLEYRPATATGVFDSGNEVLVRSQVNLGTAGFHVITPLVVAEGEAVLVNRGWVPLVLDETPVEEAPPPEGEVTIEGWVHLTQTRGALGPSDPEEGRLITMSRVDIDRIAAQAPYELAPVYLVETGGDGDQLPLPPPIPTFDDDGPHLSYAIQWFGFAVVGLVGYGFLIRRALRGGWSPETSAP